MGHKIKNLKMQVSDALQRCQAFGKSKHQAKQDGTADRLIFSEQTYLTYKAQMRHFCDFMKERHPEVRLLSDARQYVDEWLQSLIDANLSPYSIKTAAAAAAKTFGCSTTDFIKTPARNRANIVRSRGHAKRDRNFNEERHKDLVEFCKSTGLRRRELRALCGSWLVETPQGAYIDLTRTTATKGGRPRMVPVMGDVELVRRLCKAAGDGQVFPAVNQNADIHSYRAVYCRRVYEKYARDISTLPRSERYHCHADKAGVVYDRAAMKMASEALGHSRISVIASSYLYVGETDT